MKTTRRERWNATRKLRKMGFKRRADFQRGSVFRWAMPWGTGTGEIRAGAMSQEFKYWVGGLGFNCPVAAATYVLMQDAEPSGAALRAYTLQDVHNSTAALSTWRQVGRTLGQSITYAWVDESSSFTADAFNGKQP